MGSLVPAGKTGAVAAYSGSDNPWAEMGREVESGAFLSFNGNSGELTFGADDHSVPDGSTVVADMMNMEAGWMCWSDGEPVDQVWVPVTEGKPPLEHALKDHGPYDDDDDGWREAIRVPMILESVDGNPNHEFVGTKLKFESSTRGVVRSVKKLSGSFGKLFREHTGELPVVEITTESYTPREKKYGKKYAINFKIIDWLNEDGLAEILGELNDAGGEYLPEDVAGADAAAEAAEQAKADAAAAAKVKAAAKAKAAEAAAAAAAAAAEQEPEDEPIEEADPAPAPPPARRARSAAPAPAEGAETPAAEEPAQAPARRRAAAAPEAAAATDTAAAPEPRGRSEERGGRRTRRFAAEA